MFRTLSEEEEKDFRKWARDYYIPKSPISEIWHPVCQEECRRMNQEESDRMRMRLRDA